MEIIQALNMNSTIYYKEVPQKTNKEVPQTFKKNS